MISVGAASWLSVWRIKCLNVVIFSNAINVINVKLCMKILLIEL